VDRVDRRAGGVRHVPEGHLASAGEWAAHFFNVQRWTEMFGPEFATGSSVPPDDLHDFFGPLDDSNLLESARCRKEGTRMIRVEWTAAISLLTCILRPSAIAQPPEGSTNFVVTPLERDHPC
jgi:hypothetical protein